MAGSQGILIFYCCCHGAGCLPVEMITAFIPARWLDTLEKCPAEPPLRLGGSTTKTLSETSILQDA